MSACIAASRSWLCVVNIFGASRHAMRYHQNVLLHKQYVWNREKNYLSNWRCYAYTPCCMLLPHGVPSRGVCTLSSQTPLRASQAHLHPDLHASNPVEFYAKHQKPKILVPGTRFAQQYQGRPAPMIPVLWVPGISKPMQDTRPNPTLLPRLSPFSVILLY